MPTYTHILHSGSLISYIYIYILIVMVGAVISDVGILCGRFNFRSPVYTNQKLKLQVLLPRLSRRHDKISKSG